MKRALSSSLLLAAVVLTLPLAAVAQQPQPAPPAAPPQWHWGPGPWHMWNDGHLWWMPPLMMLFMFLVMGVLFYLVFARRTWGDGGRHGGPFGPMMDRVSGPPTYTALQILNERLARGEIQKEEYEDKKAAILSSGR